jgi:opacity protein-like surface antigen
MRALGLILIASLAAALPAAALAQAQQQTACSTLAQAAANGAQARIAADNAQIAQPKSVTQLTCLSSFFNGSGLNVITNLLNPEQLLASVEGQICQAVQSTWSSFVAGGTQCGLTLTGFNLGFGGIGGGVMCPKLTFGGGGPPIGSVGIGTSSALSAKGAATVPTGYTIPKTSGLW